jgi:NitT/TauT family transport system ATP-binding protein
MKLVCQDINKTYVTPRGAVTALEHVSFRAEGEQFVCIVGPSGCGKTTLLKIIAGLLKPASGTAHVEGKSAMVFQSDGLFPWKTVLQNVAFGLKVQGVPRKPREDLAVARIEQMGLGDFANRYPYELSAGMQQRVALARAFVSDAPILLMDEPFGALDAQTRTILQDELLHIWQRDHKLIVFVTHDLDEAIRLADRILVLSARPGTIRADIRVKLPRPRDAVGSNHQEMAELKWDIWKMLEADMRQQLHVSA